MSGVASWNATLFAAGLEYVGPFLAIAAGIAFIIGILFLDMGCIRILKDKEVEQFQFVNYSNDIERVSPFIVLFQKFHSNKLHDNLE